MWKSDYAGILLKESEKVQEYNSNNLKNLINVTHDVVGVDIAIDHMQDTWDEND